MIFIKREITNLENLNVPIWEKVTLSIKEAAAYSGIGECKIRELCTNMRNNDFVLHIGSHTKIKRIPFTKFLLNSDSI